MKNKIILDLQLACSNPKKVPKKSMFMRWVKYSLSSLHTKRSIELTIRIVDEKESRSLNMYFRKKNYPTNVLSFPFNAPPWINTSLIGDVILCQQTIENESKVNKLPIETYMAYVVIHGSLHLIGYKHRTDKENNIMKTLENNIMKKLGYTNTNFL